MNKAVTLLTQQLHMNRSCIAEMHEFNRSYEERIKDNNANIKVAEEANVELEAAITRLKENA